MFPVPKIGDDSDDCNTDGSNNRDSIVILYLFVQLISLSVNIVIFKNGSIPRGVAYESATISKNVTHFRWYFARERGRLGLPVITQLWEQPESLLQVSFVVLLSFVSLLLTTLFLYIYLCCTSFLSGKASPGVLLHIYPSLSHPYPLTLVKWSVLFGEHPPCALYLRSPPFTPLCLRQLER